MSLLVISIATIPYPFRAFHVVRDDVGTRLEKAQARRTEMQIANALETRGWKLNTVASFNHLLP